MTIKILAVGDVCGKTGLQHLSRHLGAVKKTYKIDFTVVNGENANVVGITPSQAEDIFDAGADVITLGNHTWSRYEIGDYLAGASRCLRPANFAPQCPGRGFGVFEAAFGPICVINLMGRFTLDTNTDNPFLVADDIINSTTAKIILVDFHAEATSEKAAMAHYLDSRASAVWGTHTHVQTSDICVLPGGTGFITDLGMTGASHSALGIDISQSIGKFLGDAPRRYADAGGPSKMECAIFEIEPETGECISAQALRLT